MLSPRKATQAGKLFLQYGLKSQENRRRIQEVLHDELKPLFGLHGTVYLIAHQHGSPLHTGSMINYINDHDKAGLAKYEHSSKFIDQIKQYRKNITSIATILKGSEVKTIYMEAIDEDLIGVLPKIENYGNKIHNVMGSLGFKGKFIDDIELYILGPELYMHKRNMLGDTEVRGMEGEHKIVGMDLLDQFYKAKDQEERRILSGKMNAVVGLRDIDMADNIMKGGLVTSIAIFGGNHHNGIQAILRKNKFRTKSKYSTADKDMLGL